jgi:NAD(P)H-dependent FMN reductase/ketosteroid isomerase-like protein
MRDVKRVAVLVGSLRRGSFSRKIAKALIDRAPRGLECEIVEIGDLPLYNEDLESEGPPAAWSRFRAAILKAHALLFVTPEYNRSIPGCLKNAIDVGSVPEGKNVFNAMPAAVVSVSPYKLGAFGANHALRQTFVFLDVPVMQQPEAYIPKVADMFDGNGAVKDAESAKFLERFMQAFEHWVQSATANDKAGAFGDFMRKRQEIARDYVSGNAASLEAILSQTEPVTFFSPGGDHQQGAKTVAVRYKADARGFQPGGTTELEVLQSGASGQLAFWTGLQRADVRVGKDGERASIVLRITEVFRVEDGEFKLVHRHADPAIERKKG